MSTLGSFAWKSRPVTLLVLVRYLSRRLKSNDTRTTGSDRSDRSTKIQGQGRASLGRLKNPWTRLEGPWLEHGGPIGVDG